LTFLYKCAIIINIQEEKKMIDIVVLLCIVIGVLILPPQDRNENLAHTTKKRHPNDWK